MESKPPTARKTSMGDRLLRRVDGRLRGRIPQLHSFVELRRRRQRLSEQGLVDDGVVHVGKRAVLRSIEREELPVVEKRFANTADGVAALEAERAAELAFGSRPWKVPIVDWLPDGYRMPALPSESRLDRAAKERSLAELHDLAGQALSIALDMHVDGFAHRDLHAGNFFVIDRDLLLTDFETAVAADPSVAFLESYDVVGRGLPSPYNTKSMCFNHPGPLSLSSVLQCDLDTATSRLSSLLIEELRDASRTFRKAGRSSSRGGRHQCKTDRVYGSFRVAGLEVSASEAQRDTDKRLRRMGLDPGTVGGRSVLDLGCNVGAISFSAASLGASRVVGIEYDAEKVRSARRVASFAGLANVKFCQGDVCELDTTSIGTFDIVFCLAIEAHVPDVPKMFEVVGAVTGDLLVFEGNAGCDVAAVDRSLRNVGFTSVELRGMSDDDLRPENNNRPLIIARK